MGGGVTRIEFVDAGFQGVLRDPGVVSFLNSVAMSSKARCEAIEGVPYRVTLSGAWDGRPRMLVRAERQSPRYERVRHMTHEQWMSQVWPKVGGLSYRPRH